MSNFIGTSGAWEWFGAKEILNRSEPNYGVRYKYYLGDGDFSAFGTVLKSRPYGDNCDCDWKNGVLWARSDSFGLGKFKIKLGNKVLPDGKLLEGLSTEK